MEQEDTKLQHVINMIIGGVDIPQEPMLKHTRISITREKQPQDYIPEGVLSFSDEDAKGIIQPHNDVLVISILVNKSRIKCVLIDLGSSTNIIRSKVVEQLGLQDRIMPAVRVLNGFNMACATTKRKITLPVNTAGIVREAKFYIIEGDIRYNALLGRPWIHHMRAVPSTLHQVLKLPVPGGIKTIYGEQPAAKEMFAIEEVILISTLTTPKEPIYGADPKAK
uniref:Peptidase A2B Ty3 transposon peptidase domain-containing protein n=1 Tax=Nicotiana tabacum TaxID=4097 RepID=A0A1S3X7P9_TOBAC|nr:PREDICTED: uncharacterized protein LOC107762022 [Nicotiana tabacum]